MVLKRRSNTPTFTHLQNRLNTVFHLPNALGRSRHGTPVRARQCTSYMNSRLSCPVAPGSPAFPGNIGAIFSQSSFEITKWSSSIQASILEPLSSRKCNTQPHPSEGVVRTKMRVGCCAIAPFESPLFFGIVYLASFFEGQVTVAFGHDRTFLHFFASELSSFLGRNASCCDFKQLFPRLAGVALQGGTGGLKPDGLRQLIRARRNLLRGTPSMKSHCFSLNSAVGV